MSERRRVTEGRRMTVRRRVTERRWGIVTLVPYEPAAWQATDRQFLRTVAG
jgi:hypothetical protein